MLSAAARMVRAAAISLEKQMADVFGVKGVIKEAFQPAERAHALDIAVDCYTNSNPAQPMKHTDILPLAREIEAYLYGEDD